MTQSLPPLPIHLQTPSRIQVYADQTYWADLLNGPQHVKTIRLHTGLPRLWLCTDVTTQAQSAIPESALSKRQPPAEVGS